MTWKSDRIWYEFGPNCRQFVTMWNDMEFPCQSSSHFLQGWYSILLTLSWSFSSWPSRSCHWMWGRKMWQQLWHKSSRHKRQTWGAYPRPDTMKWSWHFWSCPGQRKWGGLEDPNLKRRSQGTQYKEHGAVEYTWPEAPSNSSHDDLSVGPSLSQYFPWLLSLLLSSPHPQSMSWALGFLKNEKEQ